MAIQTARKLTGPRAPRGNAVTTNNSAAANSTAVPAAPSSASSDQQIKQDGSPFCFLDLPPELRNRIYSYVSMYTSKFGRTGVVRVIHPAPLSVINNSNEFYGNNRNMFSILQTCRQVYEEARDIPLSINCMSSDDVKELSEHVRHASLRYLASIQHIEVPFNDIDWEVHQWGSLKFFLNVCSLRLEDVDARSRELLARPNHPVATKIKALRGLKKFEVVIDLEYPEDVDGGVAPVSHAAEAW